MNSLWRHKALFLKLSPLCLYICKLSDISFLFHKKHLPCIFATILYSLNGYGSSYTTYIIDRAFLYGEGEFEVEETPRTISTPPYIASWTQRQSPQGFHETPETLPYEKILKRVEEGRDGRYRISDTLDDYNRFHSQLTMLAPSGEQYGGSGVLVGPHHILTAAHNVYDNQEKHWFPIIKARPALNEQIAPFGTLEVTRVYTFEKWIKDNDPNYDMALIVLNQSVGFRTGWAGLMCTTDVDLLNSSVSIIGYPGDKGFKQMWSMSHKLKKIEEERLYYDIDTYGGQSGAGINIDRSHVVGTHTLGEGVLFSGNSGVRLSLNKIKPIIGWIKETRHLKTRLSTSFISPEEMAALAQQRIVYLEDGYDKSRSYSLREIEDLEESMFYVKKAFSTIYAFDTNMTRDERIRESFKLSLKAAKLGNVEAQIKVACCYSMGSGVELSIPKTLKWYRRAALQGSPNAQSQVRVYENLYSSQFNT